MTEGGGACLAAVFMASYPFSPMALLLLLFLAAVAPSHGRSSSPDCPPRARNPLRRRPWLRNPIKALSETGTAWGGVSSDAIAGSGAALVAYTIATPFETVKTNNQMMGGRTRDTLKAVVDRGGKRSLVSGRSLRAMWTAGVPYSMILYSVYRPLKAASRRAVAQVRGIEDKAGDFAADMLAAAGAEILGLFAFIPGELVAKRMMADPTRYAGVGSALRSIVAEGGARSVFTGFGACLVRDVPYTAIQFAMVWRAHMKCVACLQHHQRNHSPRLSVQRRCCAVRCTWQMRVSCF